MAFFACTRTNAVGAIGVDSALFPCFRKGAVCGACAVEWAAVYGVCIPWVIVFDAFQWCFAKHQLLHSHFKNSGDFGGLNGSTHGGSGAAFRLGRRRNGAGAPPGCINSSHGGAFCSPSGSAMACFARLVSPYCLCICIIGYFNRHLGGKL